MSTGRRLFAYALKFKKTIILALLMLTVAVVAELSGPLIAKQMIDKHILGIEYKWYETSLQDEYSVQYEGHWYKRSDHFEANEERGTEIRVLQVDRDYYFISESLLYDGIRSMDNNTLTITKGEETASYPAVKLTAAQLFEFYKPETKSLIQLSGIYMVLILISAIFHYGQTFFLQKSANQIIQKMRSDVFEHIQKLPVQYFDHRPAGKIVSRVTNDTESIKELFVNVLANFFTSAVYMVAIFGFVFIIDYKLALVTLIIIPILIIWIVVYRKFASRYNHVIKSRLSEINGIINESIQGMTIIRAFRRQKKTTEEFEFLNEEYFKHQNKLLNLNSLTSHNLVNLLRNGSFVAIIWYFGGASLGVGTVISVGALYAFVDYLNRLFQPITGVVNQLGHMEEAIVSSQRVFQLLDEKGESFSDGQMERYRGHVAFDKVSFAYKEEEYVLNNISFEAKPGETIALVGHTGSGKSSIMNLLLRYYDIQKGKIKIDGQDISEYPKQLIRQHMAIVLQEPFLFTGTIASNVSLNDPSIDRAKVEKALKDVGADQLIQNLSKGYDEPVIEKGSTLSAGQRQLISFARALAFNPAILILDEATANIDTETESIIQNALDILKKGRTTFIIAHRLSTIRNADQIIVLDRGTILEKGNHEELMNRKGSYYQMYQMQQMKKKIAAVS
ncbi:ABC transporter ATP-binding protein [Chengkuizengella axinellae]|uniref:ABC transporter ATP-binding protein n=1 Tax=Chengkuizengella axinellae TaxID=3064388 RepID=A0ABT9J2V3_9BACL|nr:ABC transporter ATP-binding protein [Chengkuizengella sp. 2205SS18-9]MDP5275803.1 ABC transporter ATP-binding protein [Chengkuizengella sp. 2205SS18-9]